MLPRLFAALFALTASGLASGAGIEHAVPFLATGFTEVCTPEADNAAALWQISRALRPELRASRLACGVDASAPGVSRMLRISVHPHDASDPASGNGTTERVEIQLRREVVKFEQPVWYRFRFKLVEPWRGIGNRTVIPQVKQDVEPGDELSGSCPAANPFFKIEARATATGAAFLVKTRGTTNCRDGHAAVRVCGPWPIAIGEWHVVHVLLKPSQRDGGSEVGVWLDGVGCPLFSGRLGYVDHGLHDSAGKPIVNVQPRFGIYRDALADVVQTIEFADLAFWSADPTGDPNWAAIALPAVPVSERSSP